jgi:cytochrome c5
LVSTHIGFEVIDDSAFRGLEVAMWKQLTALSALLLFSLASPALDKQKSEEGRAPAEQKTPSEDANQKNPMEASPSSIAEGKRLYGFECSMCH